MTAESYWISRITPKPELNSRQIIELARLNTYRQHQMLWKLFDLPRHGSDERGDFLFRAESVRGMPMFYIVARTAPKDNTDLWQVEPMKYHPDIRNGDYFYFKLRANPVIAKKSEGKKYSPRHDVVMDAQKMLLEKMASLTGINAEGKKSEVKERVLCAWKSDNHAGLMNHLGEVIDRNERFRKMVKPEDHRPLLEMALKACSDKSLEHWLSKKGARHGFEVIQATEDDKPVFSAEGYMQHRLLKKGENAGYSSVDFGGMVRATDAEKFKDALLLGIGRAKGFGCGLMLVRRV